MDRAFRPEKCGHCILLTPLRNSNRHCSPRGRDHCETPTGIALLDKLNLPGHHCATPTSPSLEKPRRHNAHDQCPVPSNSNQHHLGWTPLSQTRPLRPLVAIAQLQQTSLCWKLNLLLGNANQIRKAKLSHQKFRPARRNRLELRSGVRI